MSTVIHRFVNANLQSVGELEFAGNAGSGDVQADGYALDLAGGNLSRLTSGKAPLLWQHDTDIVLGRVLSIRATGNALPFRATFSSAGVSQAADEKRRQLKDGVLNGISLGFIIDESMPLRPGSPQRRATKWTAVELSLCAVPVDPKGVVTERTRRATEAGMKAMLVHLDSALDEHRSFGRHYREMADSLDRLDDHRSRAGTALRAYRQALEAGDGEATAECRTRCQRCLEGLHRELQAVGDRHGDASDAHSRLMRAMRQAGDGFGVGNPSARSLDNDFDRRQRKLRTFQLAAVTQAPSGDSQWERRQRQVRVLELANQD